MIETTYSDPVSQLLTLGEESARSSPWPNYLALGFEQAHVPELIRMVLDEELYLNLEAGDEVFASLHAWRVLGQLKAEAAIEPLVKLLAKADSLGFEMEMDWERDELPTVLAMLPPTQLPLIAAKLGDKTLDMWARVAFTEVLYKIGQNHPEKRAECIQILSDQLTHFMVEDTILNTFVVVGLLELKAVETAPLIEQVFAANKIDTSVHGDWEDVQIELGLLAERTKPYEIHPDTAKTWGLISEIQQNLEKLAPSSKPANAPKKSKDKVRAAKRKQERQARKKNRRK